MNIIHTFNLKITFSLLQSKIDSFFTTLYHISVEEKVHYLVMQARCAFILGGGG